MNYQALITTHSWWISRSAKVDVKDRLFFLASRHGGFIEAGQQQDFTHVILFEKGETDPIEITWTDFINLVDKRQMEKISL